MDQSARSVLDALADIAIVFAASGTPLAINRAGERLASDPAAALALLPQALVASITVAVRAAIEQSTVWAPDNASLIACNPPMSVRPRVAPIWGGALLLLCDTSSQRWREWASQQVLATAAHDLRSPLTSLRLAVQLCADGSFGELSAQQRELLGGAVDDCARIQRGIEELLDPDLLSGTLTVDNAPANLRDILASSVLAVSPGAQDRGITVAVQAPPDLRMRTDARRLQSACTSLLLVAVSGAGAGATVTCRAGTSGNLVEVVIESPGATVPALLADILAGQLPSTQDGDPWSAALFRCWLAHRLVRALGGTMTVDGDTAGARFTALLPIGR